MFFLSSYTSLILGKYFDNTRTGNILVTCDHYKLVLLWNRYTVALHIRLIFFLYAYRIYSCTMSVFWSARNTLYLNALGIITKLARKTDYAFLSITFYSFYMITIIFAKFLSKQSIKCDHRLVNEYRNLLFLYCSVIIEVVN